MTSHPSIPPLARPVDSVLVEDIHCRRCGYNLRSLAAPGACPECGLGVALSLKSELMADANPTWLRILIRALWIVIAGALLGRALYWAGYIFQGPPTIAYHVPFLSIRLIVLLGYWKLTTGEPGGITAPSNTKTRVRLRWIVVISTIFNVVEVVGYHLMGPGSTLLVIVYAISVMISVPYIVYEYAYLMALTKRIPAPGCTRTLAWIRVLTLIAVLISSGIMLYLTWGFVQNVTLPFSYALWTTYQGANCFSTLIVVVYIVVGLRIIALLRRARIHALRAWEPAATSQSQSSDSHSHLP